MLQLGVSANQSTTLISHPNFPCNIPVLTLAQMSGIARYDVKTSFISIQV
jgi:hypothetical protein